MCKLLQYSIEQFQSYEILNFEKQTKICIWTWRIFTETVTFVDKHKFKIKVNISYGLWHELVHSKNNVLLLSITNAFQSAFLKWRFFRYALRCEKLCFPFFHFRSTLPLSSSVLNDNINIAVIDLWFLSWKINIVYLKVFILG